MILIHPSFELLNVNADLRLIELAGRTCYKSEGNISVGSAEQFVSKRLREGHETVIEHSSVTVKIICDRGVSHEIVRHRLASYSQESTRWCNYSKKGLTFIIPPCVNISEGRYDNFWDINKCSLTEADQTWTYAMFNSENLYLNLIGQGWKPEMARDVLPISLKTEIVMTCNMREWKHFFRLRTSPRAHPQMAEISRPMLLVFKKLIPIIFDDISWP